MLYKVGRFLQLVGMLLLPIAIAGNVYDERQVTLWRSLTISGIGIAVFTVGYLLQQAGRSQP